MARLFKTVNQWAVVHEPWLVRLLATLLLATLLLNAFSRDPFDYGAYDGGTYETLGWRAAQSEHLFAEGNFNHAYWSPGWVALIGTIYSLAGREPILIRVLLALSAVGSAWLVQHWTRTRGLPALACLLAMLLAAGSMIVFRFTVYYHYEVLLGSGLLVFSWLVFGGNRRADEESRAGYAMLFTAGLLFGWLTLIASKVLVLLVLLPAVQLVSGRSVHMVRSLLVIAAALIVIGLWTVRNFELYGEFIPTTSNGGINLWIANNPEAGTGYMSVETYGHAAYESSYFTGLAFEYMAKHPYVTALRAAKKAALFFNPHYGDQFPLIVLFFVAFVRFFRKSSWWRDTQGLWFVTVPFAFMAVHSVFHYEFRYLVPVWPMLAWTGAHAFTGWSKLTSVAASG